MDSLYLQTYVLYTCTWCSLECSLFLLKLIFLNLRLLYPKISHVMKLIFLNIQSFSDVKVNISQLYTYISKDFLMCSWRNTRHNAFVFYLPELFMCCLFLLLWQMFQVVHNYLAKLSDAVNLKVCNLNYFNHLMFNWFVTIFIAML